MEKDNLIPNHKLDDFLDNEGMSKEAYIFALEEGFILPLALHPTHKKLMPFRVKKHHADDTIEGYFVDDLH